MKDNIAFNMNLFEEKSYFAGVDDTTSFNSIVSSLLSKGYLFLATTFLATAFLATTFFHYFT